MHMSAAHRSALFVRNGGPRRGASDSDPDRRAPQSLPNRSGELLAVLVGAMLAVALPLAASAREFSLSGVQLDLPEVTTNVDVYFAAMRFNRASNEWDVDVTLSNKTTQAISAPMVLLVDSFTGTTGPLRVDGSSSNEMFYDFSAQVPQGVLPAGSRSATRTIALGFTAGGSPKLVTQIFAGAGNGHSQALGFVRSLNEVGQPLASVQVLETGPDGASTNVTDGAFGVATLGKSAGNYVWKFSLPGYLSVWRQATLQSNAVAVIPYPRLMPCSTQAFALSPLTGGTISNATVQAQVAGGGIMQNTTARLTLLDGQTLPAFLPQGWSPLQAFSLSFGVEPTQPATATLVPWGPINTTENAALVRFDTSALVWQVLQLVSGNGTNPVNVLLPGSGSYALVVGDAAPNTPPAATVGSPLAPSNVPAPNPTNLVASGTVTPSTSSASTVPELVTGAADVGVTNESGALASGVLLRGEVSEHYLLMTGATVVPPLYEDFVVGYQRPGAGLPGEVDARFPMRPLLLFPPQQLNQGVVHVDLYPPGAFTGGVLDTNGGLVADGGIRLLAGPGVLARQEAIQVESLDVTNFTDLAGTNFTVAAAFQVAVSGIVSNELSVDVTGAPANTTFVLARVVEQQGLFGLEPRERLHSDANGNLFSDEPTTGDRLPGLTVAGMYVLLTVQPQQGLLEGIASNSSGQPTGGLPVTVAGQPWLTFSAGDGSFKLLAPAGKGVAQVSDLTTGDKGTQSIIVPSNLSSVNISIGSVVTALQVASVTPSDNATNVPQVTSVVVTFNRAINPATLVTNAVQLLEGTNPPVAATVTLNLANTTVTLLPSTQLDAGAQFQVVLSTNIADPLGRTLGGQSVFSFSTVPLSTRNPAAQLIIYEPGATNLTPDLLAQLPGYAPGTNQNEVVVQGTEGTADPGVPVIIENEASGDTTTVLSKTDGSFAAYVPGQAQDFISATFVSLNGSRIYVPVNRQLFDDGSVGLYQQGGTLQVQGDGGAIQFTVPPNAIQSRTKFKLQSISANELQQQLNGVTPVSGVVAGGALNLHMEGEPPTLPVQVSFSVDLAQFDYPTNESPTNVAAVATIVQPSPDGGSAYQVLNQMTFTPQATSGRGVPQARMANRANPVPQGGGEQIPGSLQVFLNLSGLGFVANTVFNSAIVPLIFGPRPVTIKGLVSYIPSDQFNAIEAGRQNAKNLGAASLIGLVPGAQILGTLGQGLYTASLIGDFLFNSAELAVAKPLDGALVTVAQSSVPQIGPPGRVQSGMVYATSAADGSFLAVAPMAGDQYLVSASHPLYSTKLTIPVNPVSFNPLQGSQLSLAGVVFKNFYFSQMAPSLTPPNISIAAEPAQPAPGQSCQVQIVAFQQTAAPSVSVSLAVNGTNVLTGLPVANLVYSLTGTNSSVSGTTTTWSGTLNVNSPVRAVLTVTVTGTNSAQSPPAIPYTISFTGPTPPVSVANIPPPDTNDVHGPLVITTQPVNNGYIGENSQITVYFNKPIDSSLTNDLNGIILSAPNGVIIPTPIVRLSPDQQVLQLQYPGLAPSQVYTLTLTGESIRDLGGKPLDQIPSTPLPDSFTTTFRTDTNVTAVIPGITSGRGCVISGTRLYALDQASANANYLDIYDISNPLKPVLLSQSHLFGAARDLVVIPQYHYYPNAHVLPQTNDLVAVVGGDLGTTIDDNGNVTVPGQYLWVYAVGNGTAPQLIAQPIVSYRVGSAVTKVRWAPPYLAYEEFGSDIQLIGFVNLQELIIGYGSSPGQQASFPVNGYPGIDLNNDGDYTDPGEKPPLPQLQPPAFYGLHQTYVLQGTTQGILDFSVAGGGSTLGVVMRGGQTLSITNTPTGVSLPPMYRTLVFNGLAQNIPNPTNCAYEFGPAAYPRWVTVLNNLQIGTDSGPIVRSLALVSLEPDNDGTQKLAVIDISLPVSPTLLNEIPLSQSLLGGPIESVSMRSDGLLEVAGDQNVVVLSPSSLGVTNVPPGQLHPAIVDIIPSAGGGTRSLGSTTYGVHAVVENGHDVIVVSPPQMLFCNFPSQLVDPTTLNTQNSAFLNQLFAGIHVTGSLPPARLNTNLDIPSDLEPYNPSLHYHVLVKAPGGAGSSIELGLEDMTYAGVPFSNPGHGFAPVRAESDSTQSAIGQVPRPSCGAPIRSLTAYRVSNDTNSPYFDYYLSRPFALITESVSPERLTELQTNSGVDREILFSGSAVRTFIDPEESTNTCLGAFAGQIDVNRQVVYPVAVGSAFAVHRSYVTGPNPPPAGGATTMPGTYGTVCAQSGEFRLETIDMVLPTPRMPFEIKRQIGSQDGYEGPFGVGWEFNYNQRLTALDPEIFPAGLEMPIVVRDTQTDSEVANSKDVLFHTGAGGTVVFNWVDTNMPPGYVTDPLVQQFDYKDYVSDYYLPESGQGVFDLLVKYKAGFYERLTPEGVRYRYDSFGRLETIIDKYSGNHQDLQYDTSGNLIRIDDKSVTRSNFVQFGYFRRMSSDPDFNAELDMDTSDAYLVGKICRIRDYAGADVLYQYNSEGFLTNRLGKLVAGENGGFAGRAQTIYTYNGCQIVGVMATANGTPIFTAGNGTSSTGNQVAQSGTGLGNTVTLAIPLENSAAGLANLATSSHLADGSTTQFQFDKWGHPTSTTVSGSGGTSATTSNVFDQNGLLVYVRHPEGNSETMGYDTNNPVFRSRGNLISHQVDPGPRGGAGFTETFQYDPSYNVKSGVQTNPDGFPWTYALTPDKRDVASITYGAAGVESFGYNDNGQLTNHVDIRGVQTNTTYDATTGFPAIRSLGTNIYIYNYDSSYGSQMGLPASITLPAGAPLQFQYNANLQKVESKRGALIEDFAYDEQGREVNDQLQLGDGKSMVTRHSYDAKGFLTTNIVDGVEVDGQPVSLEYDFTPDDASRIQTIRHPQGTLQTFGYDSRGNLTNMTVGDYVEKYTVDLNNNVTSVTKGGDLVEQTVYDGLDRPVTITRKTGGQDETETRAYYPGGELQSVTISDPEFGEVSKQVNDKIDEFGRPVHQIVTGTQIAPVYQYQYMPGSLVETGPRMTTTRTWDSGGYDASFSNSILYQIYHPGGNGRVTQVDWQEQGATYNDYFTYDNQDNRTSDSDNLGTRSLSLSRAEGSLLSATNANNHVTTFDHTVLGELSSKSRADGMELVFKHDAERHTSYAGDPSAGFQFTYDNDLRLANSTLRNNAQTIYSDFDPRNLPRTVTFPGGVASLQYDLQERLTGKSVTYQSTTYSFNRVYDARDRVRVATYQQDGSALNTATYTYDEAGPLASAHFQEDGGDFLVQYGYNDDSTRNSITYPSGVVVTEQRDNSGRLTGVSDTNGNIISVTSWQGNLQPQNVALGYAINVVNGYDARGRLAGSRVTRVPDGAVLAHMRYQYDGADNLQVRQFLHRGGKADNISYDAGERVSEAKIGTVPLTSGFATPLADRSYNYHQGGLDYLTSTTSTNITSQLPVFATNWTAHDDFLLPTFVDGYERGPGDPMGNVTNALLQVRDPIAAGTVPVPATLVHNGQGEVVQIARADGVVENNFFQPDGLRYRRQLSQNNSVFDDRRFVYDNTGRLLEEYEQNGATNSLVGRYYYGSSDAPDAADLPDPSNGVLHRYYFLKDNIGSVIAVADEAGTVVERIWYDPYGQPYIEGRDTKAPTLQSITATNGGALLIGLSEPVWPATGDPGPGTNIVQYPNQFPDGIISVTSNSTNIIATIQLVPFVPGYPPNSVIQVTPSQVLPSSVSGVIGWWPADVGAIDVAKGHNGTLKGGAVNGPGLINQAFVLNGSSAYIDVPDATSLNVRSNDFTFALWVNFKNTGGEQVLAEKWDESTRSGWSFLKMPDNSLRFALGDGATNEVDVDSAPLSIPPTNWIHYAIRRQGGQCAIFTNGVQVASGTNSFDLNCTNSLKFGSREGTSFFLNGSIDEVTFFSRALSLAELMKVSGGVSLPGNITVTLNPGMLADEWGNTNTLATVSFEGNQTPGAVFYQAEPAPDTAAPLLTRSSVGSPFLFHGQYFDYETGLIYMRARFYDPYSGMFFEPDSLGYGDSVNLYAGLGNNPVGRRDPTGLLPEPVNPEEALQAGENLIKDLSGGGKVEEGAGELVNESKSVENLGNEAEGIKPTEPTPEATPLSEPMAKATEPAVVEQEPPKIEPVAVKTPSALDEANALIAKIELSPAQKLYQKAKAAPPDEWITVYRGVHGKHPDLPNALLGKAVPRGGHSDPVLHNSGDNASVYTSWTTDIETAKRFATTVDGAHVPGGVIIGARIRRAELIDSPDIHEEFEFLRQGPVDGARVLGGGPLP